MTPLLPPNAVCVCGCLGRDHQVAWLETQLNGPMFTGTRCKLHGGHKFQAQLPAGAVAPPTPS